VVKETFGSRKSAADMTRNRPN